MVRRCSSTVGEVRSQTWGLGGIGVCFGGGVVWDCWGCLEGSQVLARRCWSTAGEVTSRNCERGNLCGKGVAHKSGCKLITLMIMRRMAWRECTCTCAWANMPQNGSTPRCGHITSDCSVTYGVWETHVWGGLRSSQVTHAQASQNSASALYAPALTLSWCPCGVLR